MFKVCTNVILLPWKCPSVVHHMKNALSGSIHAGLFRLSPRQRIRSCVPDRSSKEMFSAKWRLPAWWSFSAASAAGIFQDRPAGRVISFVPWQCGELPGLPGGSLMQVSASSPTWGWSLFIHLDRSPLTKFQVNQVLKKGLQLKGFPHQSYSTHSFRIGAATSAAANGFSDEEIQSLGRWRSSAFQRYIRPASLFTASHV